MSEPVHKYTPQVALLDDAIDELEAVEAFNPSIDSALSTIRRVRDELEAIGRREAADELEDLAIRGGFV
jgi:hypothetical protein